MALFARSWQNLLHPAFYAEDASFYFKWDYNAGFAWANVFRNPNGYYNVFNNLAAQLIAMADVRLQPWLYESVAVVLSILTVALYVRLGLVRNPYLVVVLAISLALSGMNNIFYYVTLTFQMYVIVLLLFALLLRDGDESRLTRLMIVLLVPLLVFSGPYSVLAAPFAVMFLLSFKGRTGLMLWTIAVCVAYAATARESMIMFQNLVDPFYIDLWYRTVVGEILFMGLAGPAGAVHAVVAAAIIVAGLYVLRGDRVRFRLSLILIATAAASMAPLFLSTKYMDYGEIKPCHLLIGQFFWLLVLMMFLDRAMTRIPARVGNPGAVMAASLVVVFVVVDNVRHPDKWKYDVLLNIPVYTSVIHATEQLQLERENKYMIIKAKGSGIFSPTAVVGSRRPDAILVETVWVGRDRSVRRVPGDQGVLTRPDDVPPR